MTKHEQQLLDMIKALRQRICDLERMLDAERSKRIPTYIPLPAYPSPYRYQPYYPTWASDGTGQPFQHHTEVIC